MKSGEDVFERAAMRDIDVRLYDNGDIGVALDETISGGDLAELIAVFADTDVAGFEESAFDVDADIPADPGAIGKDVEEVDLVVERVEGAFDAGLDGQAGKVGPRPVEAQDGFIALGVWHSLR
jgi:hypothetical protein